MTLLISKGASIINRRLMVGLLMMSANIAAEPKRFIDAHSHYEGEYAEQFTPQQLIETLDQHSIDRILITAKPNQLTQQLVTEYPKRIIPFLSVYQAHDDKARWMTDTSIPEQIRHELNRFKYAGIGELHLFEQDKTSPVFEEIIDIARRRNLPLLVHGDAEVIHHLYTINPEARVLWAHMGTQPDPSILDELLIRYPALHIDTSVREGLLLGIHQVNGVFDPRLSDHWRHFFVKHQDRILAAVDTFSVNRWKRYGEVMDQMALWLTQLPDPVQHKIRYENAQRFFKLALQD